MFTKDTDIRFDWPKIQAEIASTYAVLPEEVTLRAITIFTIGYEDGFNIGEVSVTYGPANYYQAIFGLYADGHIACFMD
jgi:hypothetical protein